MFLIKLIRITNLSVKSKPYRILNNFPISSCKTISNSFQNKYRFQNKVHYNFKIQKFEFHTTKVRHLPPSLAIILRPLIKIVALLFGKKFKQWYSRKTHEEKKNLLSWLFLKKNYIIGFLSLYFFSICIYYYLHLEYNSLNKRSQFIILNKKQQEILDKIIFEKHLEEFKPILLTKSHPAYSKLLQITTRLINSNKDISNFKNKRWTLTVVDSDSKNAYVLPGGNIFVFLGILKLVENDDQLAIILAHEMAHAVLNHSYEQLSSGIIVELFLALPIAILWATFPDLLAGFLSVFSQSIIDIFYTLPYSRALEYEADVTGIFIAAKACIDIREAVVFWGIMRTLTELKIESSQIPWLSTHPNHSNREKTINNILTDALRVRNTSRCPPLNDADPRILFYQSTKTELLERLKIRGAIAS